MSIGFIILEVSRISVAIWESVFSKTWLLIFAPASFVDTLTLGKSSAPVFLRSFKHTYVIMVYAIGCIVNHWLVLASTSSKSLNKFAIFPGTTLEISRCFNHYSFSIEWIVGKLPHVDSLNLEGQIVLLAILSSNLDSFSCSTY